MTPPTSCHKLLYDALIVNTSKGHAAARERAGGHVLGWQRSAGGLLVFHLHTSHLLVL